MESAKRYALVGNILQTIYFIFLFIAGSLNTFTKFFHLVILANVGARGVFSVIPLLILVILSWYAASRLEDATWRMVLLIVAIITIFGSGSLIPGILFIVAFFKSGKKA